MKKFFHELLVFIIAIIAMFLGGILIGVTLLHIPFFASHEKLFEYTVAIFSSIIFALILKYFY
ncbi:MAG: hypothetical protein J5631_06500 [Spirochaetaceae bacterium]|nr:hypothetical protein [Spirochaetaceae bacterium]